MVLKSFSSAVLSITGTHDAVPSASKTLRTQPQASQRRMVWFGDDRIPVFCGMILLVGLQFDSFMLTEFARNEINQRENRIRVIVLNVIKLFSGNLSFLYIVLTLQCTVVSLRTIRLTNQNISTLPTQVYLRVVYRFIKKQRFISLYSINRLVFVNEMQCVLRDTDGKF